MAQLKEGSVIKKSTGDEVIATVNDIPEIPTSLPANGGNADTVNGFTVDTNVPANAKFTDTVTTINGKTGAITKADIVALGIPAQDTVYTHPSSHPASMITESSSRRFVSDSEKTKWEAKWDYNEEQIKQVKVNNAVNADTVNGKTVESNVPSNAKFTDTIYTHPSTHPASMIIESTSRRFVSDTEKSTWNSNKITIGKTQPNSGWWFEEID